MRKITFFLGAVFLLFADVVDDKVRSLVDPQSYVIHQKLIGIIFKNRAAFMINSEQADSVKIIAALKDNGLLDIFYKNAPRNIYATFRASDKMLFFLKAVSDSLSDLGYNFTLVRNMRFDKTSFEWTLSYKSDRAIDPALLAKRLENYRIRISDVSKEGDAWFYALQSSNIVLSDTPELSQTQEEPLFLQTPTGEYWVRLPKYASSVSARKKSGGNWHAKAVYYGADLKVLLADTRPGVLKLYKAKVPEGAEYMKITDNSVPSNLRSGIELWLEDQ
ncbi:MAG: hypothetical protein LBE89_06495 [Helicobacteraceae bacterium]|jgi:hypothetical protein|nr:hypothetical protein [Helicobacteraceae bacterium]